MPNYDFNFSEEKKSEGKQKISALMCISAPNVAVKVAVTKNLVAVKGPKVAVVLVWSGSEGLSGSGNPEYVEMIQHNKIVIFLYTNISCFIKLIYA